MYSVFPWLMLPVVCSLAGNVASAQIVLDQNFDSGALDVPASSVNGNNILLVPRYTWTDTCCSDAYRWVHFRASGVNGVQPTFHIDADSFLGSLTDHRYVYSYDQENWSFFDNGTQTGGNYQFANNTPFAQDDVYIAYGLPYPASRTAQWVSSVGNSPYITPTLSGDSSFVLGQSAGGIDDSGRVVPSHDLYGFRVTDPTATGQRLKIVVAGGAHSAETTGQHALQGMVDFLLGNSLEASQLRSRAEIFVYPQVNPDGRFGGYYRSNPENPDKDFNRFYNDPTGFTDLTIITNSMRTDTAADVDYLLDFHSWWGPWSDDNFIFTVAPLTGSPFLQSLATYEPTIDTIESSGQPGMLRIWGMSSAGLSADFAYTPEFGFHPGVDGDRLALYGESFARACWIQSAPRSRAISTPTGPATRRTWTC